MKKTLILLASGLSRRFGSENKLLFSWEGLPLYRHILDKLESLQSPDTRLQVVTNTREIQTHCTRRNIPWCDSPLASQGVSHTLHRGLKQAQPSDAYVCFVADQPKLRRETILGFLNRCEAEHAKLGCLSCDGDRGNPVWFDAGFVPALLALEGDVGGRALLAQHPEQVLLYPAEIDELTDIDYPSCKG